ncbi:para-nitrobenzyl esterase [Leucobacter luti]|uniref:Carboxylic ester hydrolase n=1 Tax=Leucobacter luti TaxID=340320 RepID=A0A4Q7TYF3_9MICO|nr:carboxylesterase/lipase family protein [Leucobacter luti]RZT64732.1 para-nitrobenzyl esterase [Leucobacter luti]
MAGGAIRGTETAGIRRFLGVPYAAPPFGELRFRAPAPVPAWDGIRDATAFGPTAPQRPYAGELGELLESAAIPGEDILTVNVWTPTAQPGTAQTLPVLVWFHGGALERGTPALPGYDGTTFAKDGIVFVSVGYRLGAEGFSVLPDAPRNLGLRDAAAGLAWVHENISAFGGDPERITVMGESAGGAIAAALLSAPGSAPLIAGAIVQSGPLAVGSAERAGRITRALARRLGIEATRDAFAAASPERLLDARAAQATGSSPLGGAPGYALALDPGILPDPPQRALAAARVPVLIGSNTDEYRLWFSPTVLAGLGPIKRALARAALRVSGRAAAAYRAAWPGAAPAEVLGQIVTDLLLRRDLVAAARARSAPTFVYEFAWQSPVRDLRAAHALEIAFVFDGLHTSESLRLAGDAAPQPLADEMHRSWVSFVHTGDPGWAPFTEAESVRRFDTRSETVPLPRAAALATLPDAA